MTTWIILLSIYIIALDIKEISLYGSFPLLVSYVKTAKTFQTDNLGPDVSPKVFWVSDFYKPFH